MLVFLWRFGGKLKACCFQAIPSWMISQWYTLSESVLVQDPAWNEGAIRALVFQWGTSRRISQLIMPCGKALDYAFFCNAQNRPIHRVFETQSVSQMCGGAKWVTSARTHGTCGVGGWGGWNRKAHPTWPKPNSNNSKCNPRNFL